MFLLHTIGSNQTDLNVDAWIDKYIFPNGCLPSVRHIAEASEGRFVMEDWHNFGADYDRTLMAWLENFKRAWPQLAGGYSERFERMFTYYLNACAGAFRSRNIQLWQVLFSPAGVEGGCGSIADIPSYFKLHLCWLRLRAPVAYLSKFRGLTNLPP